MPRAKEYPSQEYLREKFDYSVITGKLYRKKKDGSLKPVKFTKNEGYCRLNVDGKTLFAHRLIWVWVEGRIPDPNLTIEHVDGVGYNNAWKNLELRSQSHNQKHGGTNPNIERIAKSVYFSESTGRYHVRVFYRKSKRFGSFLDKESAIAQAEKCLQKMKDEYEASILKLQFDD